MATVLPFAAWRVRRDVAAAVASVPYDVVDRDEARRLAEGNAQSFLHVTKPEIDLPDTLDAYDARVYAQAATAWQRLTGEQVLRRDAAPNLYLYELTLGAHTQTGVVLCVSVPEYERNLVRKHEHTRPDKENDRVRHIETTGAQTGVVFLVHRDQASIREQVQQVRRAVPEVDFTAADRVRHRLWVVSEPERIKTLVKGFADLGPLYIADGHHRSAAAARVAAAHRSGSVDAKSPHERFLAVAFPASEVQILPYNRVVRDLGGRSAEQFLSEVQQLFTVAEGKPQASAAKQLAMFVGGRWYTVHIPNTAYDPRDPVARLDVSILQDRLLSPLLGIGDPRLDKRIEFVGGIRGEAELERRVDKGGVAFSLHPTSLEDLFAIADAGGVMPPKSTWFEPKLRDGLVVYSYT